MALFSPCLEPLSNLRCEVILLKKEILHDLMYQNQRNSGSIVYMRSCRVYIFINSAEAHFLGVPTHVALLKINGHVKRLLVAPAWHAQGIGVWAFGNPVDLHDEFPSNHPLHALRPKLVLGPDLSSRCSGQCVKQNPRTSERISHGFPCLGRETFRQIHTTEGLVALYRGAQGCLACEMRAFEGIWPGT